MICGYSAYSVDSWFDKYGLKCGLCQKAIDQKIIPGSITKNKDSYYTEYGLESDFNLDSKTRTRWIKLGLLHPRTILAKNGKRKHLTTFLLKDHKGFLPPPKKLRIGGMVSEVIDGKEMMVSCKWYEVVNPFEYLKNYGIMKYMERKERSEK